MNTIYEAVLVLRDGTTFHGEAIGTYPQNGIAGGEVVFNTVLSGYQEVLTDPSYAGQIITFTYPHIGNYGTNATDDEAVVPFARGVIVRDLARRMSNWRAQDSLESFLNRHEIPGIAGVDTRRLTRHIRDAGAMPGAFGVIDDRCATAVTMQAVREAAAAEQGTDGIDLVSHVTTAQPYVKEPQGGADRRIVAYDFGIKRTIVDCLATLGTVEVVPASTPATDVLARQPNGVFLSNGPGDPDAFPLGPEIIKDLLGEVPIFGICMGHQLLSKALGGEIVKLPFGHHGGNHPVRNVATGVIEITAQNHNFALAADSVASMANGVEVTHVNLNDGVIEGVRCTPLKVFSVQHHPEAGPGPHDSRYLFDEFAQLMDGKI